MDKKIMFFVGLTLILLFVLLVVSYTAWSLNENKVLQEKQVERNNLIQQARTEGAFIVLQAVVKKGFFDFQLDSNTKITLIESNYAQNILFPQWLQSLQKMQ